MPPKIIVKLAGKGAARKKAEDPDVTVKKVRNKV